VFRGAIFDFDEVIADSHPVHLRAWKKVLDSVGRAASGDELQFVLDGRTRDDIVRHFLGDLDAEKMAEYGRCKEQFFRDEAADVQTIKGVPRFLEKLEEAQLPLGIASSGSRARIEFLLERLKLKKHFGVVVTGDEVAQGKPHSAVFRKAAEHVGADPCELIAFEDAASGVKAAKSGGMTCVGIASSDRSSILVDVGANHVVPDFRSLSYPKIQKISCSALQPAACSSADSLARSLPD
jgi:beta-phosphoglucomutase